MYFRLPPYLQASLRLSDAVPARYARYRIPQAQALLMTFTGGVILTQHLEGRDYGIWQHHFILDQPVNVYPYTPKPLLSLHYLLEGSALAYLQGNGVTILPPRQYHLFYVPTGDQPHAELSPGLTMVIHVDIDWSLLDQASREHPVFQASGRNAAVGQPNGDQHPPSPITREIATLLEAITRCTLPEGERALFLEARVRDLLLLYVRDQAAQAAVLLLTSQEGKILLRLHTYAQDRLDERLTVAHLAEALGVSGSALQTIVHKATQHGVHHWLLKKRMNKAMDLLLTTKLPIGAIASLVIDASFTYFTRCFKKHFGHPPGYFRKYPTPPEKGQT